VETLTVDGPHTLAFGVFNYNDIPLLKAEGDTAAGLGIMIGEAVNQRLIPQKYAMRYYGLGLRTAARIDKAR
jgi:hypothetical protein